ncbi:hypothetical protein AtEden1_Chr3g0191801 [Arabidopsis thaliana]
MKLHMCQVEGIKSIVVYIANELSRRAFFFFKASDVRICRAESIRHRESRVQEINTRLVTFARVDRQMRVDDVDKLGGVTEKVVFMLGDELGVRSEGGDPIEDVGEIRTGRSELVIEEVRFVDYFDQRELPYAMIPLSVELGVGDAQRVARFI